MGHNEYSYELAGEQESGVRRTMIDDDDPPPDLLGLVRRHGGSYSAISKDAWQQFDELVAAWQVRRRLAYRRQQVRDILGQNPATRMTFLYCFFSPARHLCKFAVRKMRQRLRMQSGTP
jgi:hypothetical protein